MNNFLKENESLDDLEFKGLKIIQNKNGYKFSTDSVLLANFAKAKPTDLCVDLCSGSGVVAILFACKNNVKKQFAVELQEGLAEMSSRSVKLNKLKNIEVLNMDLKNAHEVIGREVADVVTVNPPYIESGLSSENDEISIAMHEKTIKLFEIADEAFNLLKFGGKLFMVHRADRLVDIISTLRQKRLEPKVLRLVYPKVNKEPNLVLIEAKKGAKKGLKFGFPLILNNDDGTETEELKQIYCRKS
ncbi:MAG: methyltransferase [Clostridia bacterium]|nr:methyltransferase [Clostridia bacterium]